MIQRTKMTVYYPDNTEDIFISRPYDTDKLDYADGLTSMGYFIELDDNSRIYCMPTLVKRIKIEKIREA